MSIIYCEKHDRKWDSDFKEECPQCENEPSPSDKQQTSDTPRDEYSALSASYEAQKKRIKDWRAAFLRVFVNQAVPNEICDLALKGLAVSDTRSPIPGGFEELFIKSLARDAALEEAAKVCREWEGKFLTVDASFAADQCAKTILALKKAAPQEAEAGREAKAAITSEAPAVAAPELFQGAPRNRSP